MKIEPIEKKTRMPPRGRPGGLRIGEIERDAIATIGFTKTRRNNVPDIIINARCIVPSPTFVLETLVPENDPEDYFYLLRQSQAL